MTRAGQEPEHNGYPKQGKDAPGQEKQPIGRIKQHEPKVPPAIREAAEMRRPAALVRPQDDWNLGYARPDLRSLNDELRCEFHPAATQVHSIKGRSGKAAHSAMAIADARAEEQIQQTREAGIAQVLVVPGHGARLDSAMKAVAHYDVIAFAPFFDKSRN